MTEIAFDPEFLEIIIIDNLMGINIVTGKIENDGEYIDTVERSLI